MLRIRSGVIKKVLSDEQYALIKENKLEAADVLLCDTVRSHNLEDGSVIEYIPFRVSYKEVDSKGNEKFIYDENKQEHVLCYNTSPVICAYNKEMRIISEMEEYTPIKVVVEEDDESRNRKVVCIQNQTCGKLEV